MLVMRTSDDLSRTFAPDVQQRIEDWLHDASDLNVSPGAALESLAFMLPDRDLMHHGEVGGRQKLFKDFAIPIPDFPFQVGDTSDSRL